MPNTSRYSITYPAASDTPAGNAQMQEIAEDVDNRLGTLEDALDARLDALELNKAVWIYKPTNTSRANTTVNANDPALTVNLAANARYFIRAWLTVGGSTTGCFQSACAVPTGATGWKNIQGAAGGSANAGVDTTMRTAAVAIGASSTGYGSAASNGDYNIQEWFSITTTNAGAFTIQWAQRVANSTATVLYAGSYLEVIRIA